CRQTHSCPHQTAESQAVDACVFRPRGCPTQQQKEKEGWMGVAEDRIYLSVQAPVDPHAGLRLATQTGATAATLDSRDPGILYLCASAQYRGSPGGTYILKAGTLYPGMLSPGDAFSVFLPD